MEESVDDEFRDAYVEQMKKLTMGDPARKSTDLGPMARGDLRDNLHEQVCESVKSGATCLTGGEIPGGRGFFYPCGPASLPTTMSYLVRWRR